MRQKGSATARLAVRSDKENWTAPPANLEGSQRRRSQSSEGPVACQDENDGAKVTYVAPSPRLSAPRRRTYRQPTQGKAQADAVAAFDIAVDDHGGYRRLVQPGAAFDAIAEIVVHVDIGHTQIVNRCAQAGLGMRAHLGRQVTGIEQNEFGGLRFGLTHQRNEVAQRTACTQFKQAACLQGLLLKVVEQISSEGMAATVRPTDNQDTHDIALDTATQSECAMVWLCAVKAIRRNACNGVNFPQAA